MPPARSSSTSRPATIDRKNRRPDDRYAPQVFPAERFFVARSPAVRVDRPNATSVAAGYDDRLAAARPSPVAR
jgi:hypothetical protein